MGESSTTSDSGQFNGLDYIVIKAGGVSVSNPQVLDKILKIGMDRIQWGVYPIFVFSALKWNEKPDYVLEAEETTGMKLGGITDVLIGYRELVAVNMFHKILETSHLDFMHALGIKEKNLTDRIRNMIGDFARDVQAISKHSPQPDTFDYIQTFGEGPVARILAYIFQQKLKEAGLERISTEAIRSGKLGVYTDRNFGNANIETQVSADAVSRKLKALRMKDVVPFVTGFDGRTRGASEDDYLITALGRNGSDTTAIFLAYCLTQQNLGLDSQRISVYLIKDTDGVYTISPKIDKKNYETITTLPSSAAVEAGNLHTKAVKYVDLGGLEVTLMNPLNPNKHTTIKPGMGKDILYLVADPQQVKYVTIRGIPDRPGELVEVCKPISDAEINLAEVSHARYLTMLVLDKNLGNLEKAKKELAAKGYEIEEKDAWLFRLIGNPTLDMSLRLNSYLLENYGPNVVKGSRWIRGSNALSVTLDIDPKKTDPNAVARELHERFVAPYARARQLNLFPDSGYDNRGPSGK